MYLIRGIEMFLDKFHWVLRRKKECVTKPMSDSEVSTLMGSLGMSNKDLQKYRESVNKIREYEKKLKN